MFYPRVAEPRTGARDLEWVEASGGGTVYAVTVVRNWPPDADHNVALVDLDEGPRMMSRIDGLPVGQARIGLKVKARIVTEDGARFVVFVPRDASLKP